MPYFPISILAFVLVIQMNSHKDKEKLHRPRVSLFGLLVQSVKVQEVNLIVAGSNHSRV